MSSSRGVGSTYDFADARKFLRDLPTSLEAANPGAVSELQVVLQQFSEQLPRETSPDPMLPRRQDSHLSGSSQNGKHGELPSSRSRSLSRKRRARAFTVADLQEALLNTIPQIISVVYNPDGSDNQLSATVHDVLEKAEKVSRGAAPRIRRLRQAIRRIRRLERLRTWGSGAVSGIRASKLGLGAAARTPARHTPGRRLWTRGVASSSAQRGSAAVDVPVARASIRVVGLSAVTAEYDDQASRAVNGLARSISAPSGMPPAREAPPPQVRAHSTTDVTAEAALDAAQRSHCSRRGDSAQPGDDGGGCAGSTAGGLDARQCAQPTTARLLSRPRPPPLCMSNSSVSTSAAPTQDSTARRDPVVRFWLADPGI